MEHNVKPDAAASGKERRRFTRVALDAHVAVTVLDTNALFHSRLRDLSENGVFVITNSTRPIGTNIRITITVKESQLSVCARGIIVHEVPPERASEGAPAGIGVMFTEVDDASVVLLRRLVAAGEPLP